MKIPDISFFEAELPPQEAYFSILIPSWNNLPYLQKCIESIRKHSKTNYEILVHVNEGKDGTAAWLKSQKDISYTVSEENAGVCFAMNALRKLANASYLLYINDDMYALPAWDEVLKKEIESLPDHNFYLSSTMIEPRAQSNCSIEKNYGTSLDTFQEEKLLNEFADLPFHDWHGSTWPPCVVHKDLWDQVGGYSIEFSPGMYSDPDFSMKLWQIGVRYFKGLSASRVYHFGSISVKRVKQNKGYFQFIKKWKMSNSTLSKYYLRRGEHFDGYLTKRTIPLSVHLKNWYYRFRIKWMNLQ